MDVIRYAADMEDYVRDVHPVATELDMGRMAAAAAMVPDRAAVLALELLLDLEIDPEMGDCLECGRESTNHHPDCKMYHALRLLRLAVRRLG
jgi:hypothetical protein